MDALTAIVQVSLLVFVISSMLAMGFSLTVEAIITPLKNVRLVLTALAVNFVAVPLVAWGVGELIGLDKDIFTGLIILATAAGAPFLPKLAGAAKGNTAFSVGLMVMLMVTTIIYMPIVLPMLLSGVTINPWDIAKSLIVLMLLPLAIGLFIKARWSSVADGLQPHMAEASSVALLFLLAGGIIVQWSDIVELLGTGGFISLALFFIISLVIGYFAGGSDPQMRSVMGLGTAQRNVSAAMVVGAQNFTDTPDVISTIIVGALVGLVILLPIAGELGKRATGNGSQTKSA
ncbi:MAG: bile acid:sodium symporter [Actinomycetia bacterium]|nr:bile acid:sodium symporter [Actinomycetes bacterium]